MYIDVREKAMEKLGCVDTRGLKALGDFQTNFRIENKKKKKYPIKATTAHG